MSTTKSMTPAEAARTLGVTRPYIYELIAEGRLGNVWKAGRCWRIPSEVVQAIKRARQARQRVTLLLSQLEGSSNGHK